MNKRISKILFIATLTFLIACNSNTNEKIEGLKSFEILVVTLDLETTNNIEKIILNKSQRQPADSILKFEIADKKTIRLKCPQQGEGTFSICVYTPNDTLCSQEHYVEGGYRPKLKLKNNKFETVE